MDVFVEFSKDNAQKLVTAFREFGFASARVTPALFLKKGKILRMGSEPMRLEVLNEIDGVSFDECFEHRRVTKLANLKINFIDLPRLLKNKRASGRLKDLGDVEALLRKTKRKAKARKSK